MCMVILFAEFCQLLSAQNTHTQKHKKKQEQKSRGLTYGVKMRTNRGLRPSR